jgi:hypothetical protein
LHSRSAAIQQRQLSHMFHGMFAWSEIWSIWLVFYERKTLLNGWLIWLIISNE